MDLDKLREEYEVMRNARYAITDAKSDFDAIYCTQTQKMIRAYEQVEMLIAVAEKKKA